MLRPKQGDYIPYYETYISKIEGDDILKTLETQLSEVVVLFKSIPEEKGSYAYADGKWTIKELIGHINDTERVFAYRAMCFARGEKKSLPGFEQDDYVRGGDFNNRSLSDLINEFRLLRESDLVLFKSFNEDALSQIGNGNQGKVTVLAILYIIAGHTQHHINILKAKYLA